MYWTWAKEHSIGILKVFNFFKVQKLRVQENDRVFEGRVSPPQLETPFSQSAATSHPRQGCQMLCSQFSAILANFRRKKLAFFSKTNVIITIFAKTSSSLSKNRQFFR
jgi:hypothetical protein